MAVDFGKKLQFPDIVPSNLRTNMVLWSPGSKGVALIVLIELTVPRIEREHSTTKF